MASKCSFSKDVGFKDSLETMKKKRLLIEYHLLSAHQRAFEESKTTPSLFHKRRLAFLIKKCEKILSDEKDDLLYAELVFLEIHFPHFLMPFPETLLSKE